MPWYSLSKIIRTASVTVCSTIAVHAIGKSNKFFSISWFLYRGWIPGQFQMYIILKIYKLSERTWVEFYQRERERERVMVCTIKNIIPPDMILLEQNVQMAYSWVLNISWLFFLSIQITIWEDYDCVPLKSVHTLGMRRTPIFLSTSITHKT